MTNYVIKCTYQSTVFRLTQMQSNGNRCNHHSNFLRKFCPPQAHKRRPSILVDAHKRVELYYYNPETYLTALSGVNDSNRKQRSERRESSTAVLQLLLHYTDLLTLKVGTPNFEGNISGLRTKFIADKTGFGECRVFRALKDLVESGYICSKNKIKRMGEQIIGIREIKISRNIFADLGISNLKVEMARHFKIKIGTKIHKKASMKTRNTINKAKRIIAKVSSNMRSPNNRLKSRKDEISERKAKILSVGALVREGLSSKQAMHKLGIDSL